MTNDSPASSPTTRFLAYADRFTSVVDGVRDFSAPTPCADWDARALLAHVRETERDFFSQHGVTLASTGSAADSTADPAAAWRAHLADVRDALAADPGLADRGFEGFFGSTTVGETLCAFYGWDLVIHAWDLARASGQPFHIDDREAADHTAVAEGWGDALYAEGICAPAVQVGAEASVWEQLLGRLGRDPAWAPSR